MRLAFQLCLTITCKKLLEVYFATLLVFDFQKTILAKILLFLSFETDFSNLFSDGFSKTAQTQAQGIILMTNLHFLTTRILRFTALTFSLYFSSTAAIRMPFSLDIRNHIALVSCLHI
jgi:hypothetical protein